jgi:protein-S-isoprenylcysteine O-methyltransferase Ste14
LSRVAIFNEAVKGGVLLQGEGPFRVALLLLWGCLFAVRGYYAAKLRRAGVRVTRGRQAVQREGRWKFVTQVALFVALVGALAIYALRPRWMSPFVLPLPSPVRWAGVLLGVLSLSLLVWVQETLGTSWSMGVDLREQHISVTDGPYRRVRHPMYTALLSLLTASCLVSANVLFFLGTGVSTAVIYRRIAVEERMLGERFGGRYREYVRSTGRLWPRIGVGRGNSVKRT